MRTRLDVRPFLLVLVISSSPLLAIDLEPEDNPLAPTWFQVEARLDRIEEEVRRLRDSGHHAEADEMHRQAQHFRDQLAGTAPSLLEGPQLDLIGIYSSRSGSVVVEVRPTDRPIVLALTSVETVQWDLRLHAGARLEKLILSSGYNPLRPKNLPTDVPIEVYTYQSQTGNVFHAWAPGYDSYPGAARTLYQLTGLPVSTFQSAYTHVDPSFAIGGAYDEWAAQRVLTEMQPLYARATAFERGRQREAARSYEFPALLRTPLDGSFPQTTALARFTPLGPDPATVRTVAARVTHLAADPEGGAYYGLVDYGVYSIDPNTGELSAQPLGAERGHFAYPVGLAFDSKRDRLVLATLLDDGKLYSYSSEQNAWSILASLKGIDLQSLTYSATTDSFYGLTAGPGGMLDVLRYDAAEGLLLERFSVPALLPSNSYSGYQLIATDDQLALITPSIPDLYNPHLAPRVLGMLIDPRTGAISYSGPIAIPEPVSLLMLCAGASLLGARRRRCPG